MKSTFYILLCKKQCLPRKYLLQLYSNCYYTEQWQNVAISSKTWRRARSVHDVVSSHTSISVEIPTLFFPHLKFQVEWCFQLDLKVFHVRAVQLVFFVSKFKRYSSHACLQELACLVENHFLSQITKFVTCSLFRF